jgi:trehalose/maltose hydrolase-like predicted phosphorylase
MRSAVFARRFEAIIWDWGGTAAPGGVADLPRLIEEGSAAGIELAIVTGAQLDDLDRRVGARPAGPGRLMFAVDGGSEVFRVNHDGPQLVQRTATTEEDAAVSLGIGLADEAGAVRRVRGELWRSGIRNRQMLVVSEQLVPEMFAAVLTDQIARRHRGELPVVNSDPQWTITIDEASSRVERVHESLLTLADGRLGTRGSKIVSDPADDPSVLLSGVYTGQGPQTQLLSGPRWNLVELAGDVKLSTRRVLDLRSGTLTHDLAGDGQLQALLFSSLPRPATTVMRIDGRGVTLSGSGRLHPPPGAEHEDGESDGSSWMRVVGSPGSIVAASDELISDHEGQGQPRRWTLDRLACYGGDPTGVADERVVLNRVAEARTLGFDGLLGEHRRAWAARWEDADIRVAGDAELQLFVRLALFHLIASVADEGEAAVGARGLTGEGYRGHVFWDSDVYVLPFLAATHPPAARAMLEYRVRRLPAALHAARSEERAGARFAWESAASGEDMTPVSVPNGHGGIDPIYTGQREEHIVADVAWAAAHYIDWTCDEAFAAGPGLELLVQTARWWASRIELDAHGTGHIRGVIGPDEYHELVDDDAYTNVMARWNLRRAASADHAGVLEAAERHHWLELADAIADGYDPSTGIYEQFAGFSGLEPLLIAELAPQRPVAADMLLGRERTRSAQVVKQPDVLMLHYLLPDEVAAGSLEPNLDYYEPRTAHGSTLSPGVHAALLARAGRLEQATDLLRLTSRIDFDDIGGVTAGGLHVAAMGSVWRTLAFGFGGLRPVGDTLAIDPVLAPGWETLELRVRFRGSRVRVRVGSDAVEAEAEPSIAVLNPAGERVELGPKTQTFTLSQTSGGKPR